MWQITEHVGNKRRGMSLDDFRTRFLAECTAHRAQGRALAFAFILFDARQPHLRRALEQDAYWESLDELSGRLLTVFSFDTRPQPRPERPPADAVRMIVDIRTFGVDLPRDLLTQHFPGLTLDQLPCVLFFQVDREEVIDSCAVGLAVKAVDPEAAYNELASVIAAATTSLRNVQDENASNARELYQLIVEGLRDRRIKQSLFSAYRGAKNVASAAGILKLISSLV